MAESVTASLLTVSPVDASSVNSSKSRNIGSNREKSGDFSRVLDGQQSRDTQARQGSERSEQAKTTSGKDLPPAGNETAETASGPRDEAPEAASTVVDVPASERTSADAQATRSSGEAALLASGSDAMGSGKDTAAVAAESDASELLLSGAASTRASTPAPLSVATTATGAGDDAALANLDSGFAKTGTVPGLAAGTGGLGTAPTPTPGPDMAPGTAVPVTVSFSQTALPASVSGRGAQSVSPMDLRQASVSEAGAARTTEAVEASALLNRSTVDWLRAVTGSESAQRALADAPLDGSTDLARNLGSTPRGDIQLAPATAATSTLLPAGTGNAASAAAAPLAGTDLPEYALSTAPDDVEFPGELTARMKTLVRDGVREARLQLHPAELGRLQVTVTTEGDQARVVFTAETTAARELIEQSMPRLREMLEQSGLQLAQSDVGQQDLNSGQGYRGDDSLGGLQGAGEGGDSDAGMISSSAVATLSSSRIDTYI